MISISEIHFDGLKLISVTLSVDHSACNSSQNFFVQWQSLSSKATRPSCEAARGTGSCGSGIYLICSSTAKKICINHTTSERGSGFKIVAGCRRQPTLWPLLPAIFHPRNRKRWHPIPWPAKSTSLERHSKRFISVSNAAVKHLHTYQKWFGWR